MGLGYAENQIFVSVMHYVHNELLRGDQTLPYRYNTKSRISIVRNIYSLFTLAMIEVNQNDE
jgi:hypothetical protein